MRSTPPSTAQPRMQNGPGATANARDLSGWEALDYERASVTRPALSLPLGRNQMRHLRLALELEALDLRLQHAVRIGDALVLAQVLEPGLDQEGLDEARRVGGVLEYAPRIGAVAPPF